MSQSSAPARGSLCATSGTCLHGNPADVKFAVQTATEGTGFTITQMRRHYGGDDFTVFDPFWGRPYHVSLRPWARTDPDKTYVSISFGYPFDGGIPEGAINVKRFTYTPGTKTFPASSLGTSRP